MAAEGQDAEMVFFILLLNSIIHGEHILPKKLLGIGKRTTDINQVQGGGAGLAGAGCRQYQAKEKTYYFWVTHG
jgi:hypothetical protein